MGVQDLLYSALSHFTYVAMVVLLGAAGMGVPISQDLVLLLGGLLASRGITSLVPAMAAGYLGALLGDTLMHRWGARLGPKAYEQPWVRKLLSVERQEKLRRHFQRHGALTIVVGRHTPLLRAVIFFLSGASGVPRWKMLAADAFSAVLTVPLWVWLGFKFGEQLPALQQRIHHLQWIVGGVALAALLAIFLIRRHRRRLPPVPLPRQDATPPQEPREAGSRA